MILLHSFVILYSICSSLAAPHYENQVLLAPNHHIPDSSVYHRRSVLLYPNENLFGNQLQYQHPQQNLVYLGQDGQPIPNYFNNFYNFVPRVQSPAFHPAAFPQKPALDEQKPETESKEGAEGASSENAEGEKLENAEKPEKEDKSKLEIEPEAELIPDEVKIGSRPSNDAPPRPAGPPGYVPGAYPGLIPQYPQQPGLVPQVPRYPAQPGLVPQVPQYPTQPGLVPQYPTQTPQVFYYGNPQFFGANPGLGGQPTYRYTPGGYEPHRFFIYQQPTVVPGQYPIQDGQSVIYLSGLKNAAPGIRNRFQEFQIPGRVSQQQFIERDQLQVLEQPKENMFTQFTKQQAEDLEMQREVIAKIQETMDHQRIQNKKFYVDELHQPIKPSILSRLSASIQENANAEERSDDAPAQEEHLEDDSVTIEAKPESEKEPEKEKEKPELNHPDIKPDPSVAEAKPEAIAIAGVGGIAQAAPGATSLSGPAGLSVSNPVATALAGPLPQKKPQKKN